jgi:tripartite-type tricarboxylate transporter receptor subunit TctC
MVKLRVGLLALVAAMSTAADAQEWPSRPVRFIVPFPAGGSTDVGARLVGEYLSRSLGRQIVDVPTYQEAGIKGLVLEQWLGVFVPAGTPPAIVARLNTDINKALSEAAIREGFMQSAQTAGRRARGRILATRASRFRDLRPPGEGAEHQGRVELPKRDIGEESVAKRLAELGADLPADAERTPQALGKLVRSEIDKWVPLIQAAGVVGSP